MLAIESIQIYNCSARPYIRKCIFPARISEFRPLSHGLPKQIYWKFSDNTMSTKRELADVFLSIVVAPSIFLRDW